VCRFLDGGRGPSHRPHPVGCSVFSAAVLNAPRAKS
jgi:hypothetical protein